MRGFKNSQDNGYEAYYFKEGPQKVLLNKDDITYLEDLYDEEILSVDELVGNFLNNLDKTILDKTIIIIFSDHGEMFAKHGRFGRAGATRGTLYDDVAHIPLIMKIPEQDRKEVSGLVQLIDVMPTLLDVLDMDRPQHSMQGKNLLPLVKGEEEDINEYVFAGSKFGRRELSRSSNIYPVKSSSESVRDKEWKLIHEIKFSEEGEVKEDIYELHNIKDDPDELRNITNEQPQISAELKGILEDWTDTAKNFDVRNISSPQLLPPEIREAAKERGYW